MSGLTGKERAAMLEMLGHVGGESSLPLFTSAINGSDKEVKLGALRGLTRGSVVIALALLQNGTAPGALARAERQLPRPPRPQGLQHLGDVVVHLGDVFVRVAHR